MEVQHTAMGAPVMVLSEGLQSFIQQKFRMQKIQVLLSLADEAGLYALAFVVLSSDNTAQ
jgi:phosphopantetheinyl transferase (holo-ACP synthase)